MDSMNNDDNGGEAVTEKKGGILASKPIYPDCADHPGAFVACLDDIGVPGRPLG